MPLKAPLSRWEIFSRGYVQLAVVLLVIQLREGPGTVICLDALGSVMEAASEIGMALLDIQNVCHAFGGLVALDSVTFSVFPDQIKAVIGPNGAGKTTLFNVVSGILRSDTGDVLLEGSPITGLQPYEIGQRGISRTFQNLSLFAHMSVLENVMVGCHCRTRAGIISSALRLPRHRRDERQAREKSLEYLAAVGLADRRDWPVAELPFGQRRLVELARALATEAKLLLLDEPASGLNTKETDDLGQIICQIRDRGIAILLVEHDMSLVMDISDSIFVLNFGKPVAEGPPTEIRSDPEVISIYLGGDFDSVTD